MAFFLDEAVRESMQPAGGAVFNLLGPVAGRQAFSQAKRFDGTAVQTGDKTCVTVVQNISGVIVRAVSIATLTLGGSNLLTLNSTPHPAGSMYFSTAGASFPGFNTLDVGEVFITTAVPLLAQFDDTGQLLNPFNYRKTIAPDDLATFLAEIGVQDNEAVIALQRVGNAFTRLGGLFAQNHASTGTADNIDKFVNPNTGQGRVDRVPLKVVPTSRGNTIGAGGVLDILDASDPLGQWFITAWRETVSATRLQGAVLGDAADPKIFGVIESEAPPNLEFQLSGTTVRLRNASGTQGNFSYTIERVG